MLESLPEGSSDSPWPSGFLGERSCLSWSSVPRGAGQSKRVVLVRRKIFINNLNNNNTVDLNGHTLEAYRMVRKEAWGLAAVLGGRGWGAGGAQGRGRGVRSRKGPRTAEGRGACTEDEAGGGAGLCTPGIEKETRLSSFRS